MEAGSVRRALSKASPRDAVRSFYSGTNEHPIFVDFVAGIATVPGKTPVVMVHGGAHTGGCYLSTPDLRGGWASQVATSGRDVFVPDWPGHGRSPMSPDFATLATVDVARSLIVLLEEVGPAVLLVHSASGPMAWWIAELRPDLVAAIVGVAPGPPANLLPDLPADPAAIHALRDDASVGCPVYSPETRAVWLNAEFAAAYWANAPRFPKHAFERYCRSIVPESARIFNERFNIGGRGLKIENPKNLNSCRILIVTGECDPRHPQNVDSATAAFLGADFMWLPDRGITGNGHMLMIEDNSDVIVSLIIEWLDKNGC